MGIILFSISSCNRSEQEEFFTTKSSLSEDFLINAIVGKDTNYTQLDALLELLLDNIALSKKVQKTMIAENRLPDDFVELCLILSCPIENDMLTYLSQKRPNINQTSIQNGNSIYAQYGYKSFSIVNHPFRTIILGDSLVRTPFDCNDDSCSSVIGSYYDTEIKTITWGTGPTTDYMQRCNPHKWVCGDPIYIQGEPLGGGLVLITVTCSNSENKCVRIPKTAR